MICTIHLLMSLSPAGTYMLSSLSCFSNCVDVYLSCRNIRGNQAGGRQELPWCFDSKLCSLLSGWVRRKSVKCHLVCCSQLVWLTQGGASEPKATTNLDHSEQRSPKVSRGSTSLGLHWYPKWIWLALIFWTVSAKGRLSCFASPWLWEGQDKSLRSVILGH